MSGKIVNYYDGPTECVGYLSIPESSNLVPLVLVAHTWKGRSDFEDQKVLALNDLGYAALSIDIFGGGVNGQSIEENQALIAPFVNDRQLFRKRLISAVEFGKTIEGVDSSKYTIYVGGSTAEIVDSVESTNESFPYVIGLVLLLSLLPKLSSPGTMFGFIFKICSSYDRFTLKSIISSVDIVINLETSIMLSTLLPSISKITSFCFKPPVIAGLSF